MGLLSDSVQALTRGAARGVMSSKRGNKNYYKGKGTGRQGTWTSRNKFVVQDHLLRQYIVPEGLSESPLKPYVSPQTPLPVDRTGHSVLDYFKSLPLNASQESSSSDSTLSDQQLPLSVLERCQRMAQEAVNQLNLPKKLRKSMI